MAYVVVKLGEAGTIPGAARMEFYDHELLWAHVPPGGVFTAAVRHDGHKWFGRTLGLGGLEIEFTTG